MILIILIFLLSHGFNVIFGSITFVITLRRYFETKISLILTIASLMLAWSLINFLLILPILFPGLQILKVSEVLPFINLNAQTVTIIDVISVINVFGSGLVVGLFILFIDNFEGEISAIKTAVAASLIMVCLFVGIASLGRLFLPTLNSDVTLSSTIVSVNDTGLCSINPNSLGTCLLTMRWSTIPSLIIFPCVILCGIWAQTELNLSAKHALSETQIKQIKYMKIGAVFDFFIGPVFGALGVVLVDILDMPLIGTYSSEIIGYLFISIGVFMIGLSYISYKQAAFLQPQRIEILLVINKAGLPLLEYEFIQNTLGGDTNLISGAITAISALMKESLGVSSEVEKIQFHEKELLLKFSKGVAFILITSRTSSFLNTSLANFSEKFLQIFEKEIDSTLVNTDTFRTIIPELKKSFGL